MKEPTHGFQPIPEPRRDEPGQPGFCTRCQHEEALHPVHYVCDKYPYPENPLQLCGCEAETLDEVCRHCGHKARWHKTRHRCQAEACGCWAFAE